MIYSEAIDLFKEKRTLTVSELTSQIKELLEGNFFDIYVVGEVSNLSTPISGHVYFTLKDENAAIKCVLFKFQRRLIDFDFKNGDRIIVRGRLNVYEKRGEYQIVVDYLEPDGIGALYIKFEKLKRKLEKEGLFDSIHKKRIPEFPSKIVVITSPTGAAIRDILNILKRRFYNINVIIAPVKVQGEEAKYEIVQAIKLINLHISDADVIILARGGGSIEDLQPFNEEIVARAIFESNIPIISAVGHETDFTIADFTADLRAPTPSAAAELVVKNKEDVLIHLDNLQKNLISLMKNNISLHRHKIVVIEKSFYQNFLKFKNIKNKLKNFETSLNQLIFDIFNKRKNEITNLKSVLISFQPNFLIEKKRNEVERLTEKMKNIVKNFLKENKMKIKNLENLICNLGPENVLKRGYSIVFKGNKVISNSEYLRHKDKVKIVLYKGNVKATIDKK